MERRKEKKKKTTEGKVSIIQFYETKKSINTSGSKIFGSKFHMMFFSLIKYVLINFILQYVINRRRNQKHKVLQALQ